MSLTRRFELFCDKLGLILQSPNTALIAFACTACYFFNLSLGADPDLFARMAVGRLVRELGFLPLQDPFAFSPKKPIWIDHEWLAGVIFYDLYQLGGDKALYLLKCLAAILTFHFLLQAQLIYSKKNKVAIVWTLICALNCTYLWASTIRAQVFSYLFLAYMLKQLLKFIQSKRWLELAFFPLIFAAWCNLHGGFVLGLALLIVFLLTGKEQDLRVKLLVTLIFCCAATFLNPYPGLSLWSFLLEALRMPRPSILEWQAPSLFAIQAQVQNVVLIILGSAFVLDRKPADALARVILITSAILAYMAERFAAVFMFSAIVFASEFSESLGSRLSSMLSSHKSTLVRSINFTLLLIILLCAFSIGKFLVFFRSFELDKSSYPVAALAWLKQNEKSGRLLVDFNLGSFAIWVLYPNFRVSLDGRYEELYPESTLRLVESALSTNSETQRQALEILSPSHILLHISLLPQFASNTWMELYRDNSFVLLKQPQGSENSK